MVRVNAAFIALFPALAALAPTLVSAEGRDYSVAHAYSREYDFNERDGWLDFTAGDADFKYSNLTQAKINAERRALGHEEMAGAGIKRHSKQRRGQSALDLSKQLKALGQPNDAEDVQITWYSGNDLKNPSCWPQVNWTPTDQSFISAVTLEGWVGKSWCFEFLELCNPQNNKCIFTRVVDSCAGCAQGSKHVDLTKGSFGQLADLGQGTLKVKMRHASNPSQSEWAEWLWGPFVSDTEMALLRKAKN